MKSALFFASLSALATAASAKQSAFESLPEADKTNVYHRLAKWKTLYGPIAEAKGFTPSQESLSVNSHSTEELERFHHTMLQVEAAAQLNPLAQFSEFNQFALLTDEEFSNMLGSSFGDHPNRTSTAPVVPEAALEAQVDWSTHKCNPPVHEQGNCGSCWAFSTLGTAEAAHCLSTGELLDLSEQQVTSCDTANKGCKGGYPPNAIDWILNGVCTEEAWPYTSGVIGQNERCTVQCTKKKLSLGETDFVSGEAAILNALNKQPVTVVVEAGNPVWKNYKGGVVTQCPGSSTDHAVIAVGYGTSTDDYIKIKNSWGPQWGDNGYIYLKRGGKKDGTCNVGEYGTFPQLTGTPKPQPSSSSPTPSSSKPAPSTATPTTTRKPAPPVTTQPVVAPTTTSPTRTPKPTSRTHKPKKTTMTPSVSTSSPPTPPSTKSPAPSPSTPASGCGSCKGCYFADVKWCLAATFGKADCETNEGALWCGN